MLNVNEGHNTALMNQCRILKEYAQYVAAVRRYAAAMDLDQAVERAVNECIREGILAEFLLGNRAEVISVSIFEYDKEKEEKKLRKAEYEAGVQEGIQKGRASEIIASGTELGISKEDTLKRLQEKLGISRAEAEKYMMEKE